MTVSGLRREALGTGRLTRTLWPKRKEAATAREVQTQHRGTLKGEKIETDRRPLCHLAATPEPDGAIICRGQHGLRFNASLELFVEPPD